jgi:hypothetical protein
MVLEKNPLTRIGLVLRKFQKRNVNSKIQFVFIGIQSQDLSTGKLPTP